MVRVGVRELRQNLSVYLRRVKEGESLEVTEHGHPVALLGPLPRDDDPIARLERRGLVVWRGTGNIADLPSPVKAPPGARPMSEILDEIREDRI